MEYKVDTCGLVIALVDNQSDMSSEELFEKEFEKDIFTGYKDDLKKYGDIDSDFYKPVGYHLFGDCNMAVISLIDDFAFPNRVLHTGHGYSSDSNNERKYSLQIINGVHSWIDGTPESHTLKDLALSTFLKQEERLPFIGIVNYKINNGLLIGDGIELLEMIKHKLYLLKKEKFSSCQIELICIDSFSNNELVVIYFAKKLSDIVSFTNETRILKLRHLVDHANKETIGIVNNIAAHSLLTESLYPKKKKEEEENKEEKEKRLEIVKDAHIFSTSFSHLGYDMILTDCLEPETENLIFQYQWDLKPGHYNDFKQAIINKGEFFKTDTEERIMAGTDMMQLVVRSESFEDFRTRFEKLSKNEQIREFIRKQRINVIFSHEVITDRTLNDVEKHPELMKRMSKRGIGFSPKMLNKLRKDLDACHVSKVLTERTLKMYGAFNDCINDLLFFNYFIELRGYLEGIRKHISEYRKNSSEETSLEDFHIWLNRMIRNFEQAYYNRFHHSSRMRNIFDFNLEYSGGIQQLISAYDTAYKVILKALEGEEADYNCVYVSGYERVSSDRYSLRINISHITYPELYAATVWKEAINFHWHDLGYISQKNLNEINVNNNLLLFDDNNIRILRNRILHNKAYNPSSYVHHLMLNSTNKLFIHYLMADAFVFKTGYLSNSGLFSFWYWHYFSQMSHFYTHEGEMLPEVFIKFMIRCLFIKRFGREEPQVILEDYIAFDPKFSELWHCYLHEINTFIDVLLEELDKSHFLMHLNAESILLDYQLMGLREKSDFEKIKKTEEFITTLGSTLQEQTTAFNEGKIVILDRTKTTDFSFIRNLMFSYLKTVSNLNSLEEKKSIHILERDKDGKIMKRDQYCSILSDPLGGMLIYDNRKREKYFKLRSVFYKSLWGASLQIKKDCLEDYFKE